MRGVKCILVLNQGPTVLWMLCVVGGGVAGWLVGCMLRVTSVDGVTKHCNCVFHLCSMCV